MVEPNQPVPDAADDAVLLVQRHGVFVGGCPSEDGGGGDAGADGGVGDAGVGDAGAGDGGVSGCETIEGDAISLVVHPTFTVDQRGARFALLFVTPSHPIVESVPDPFEQLSLLSRPEIIVHEVEVPDPSLGSYCDDGGGCGGGEPVETGGGCSFEASPSFDPPQLGDGGLGDGGVALERVGPFEIVRAQPADEAALASLLDGFGYLYQAADLDAVAPYLARGYTVVAVRIATDGPATQLDALQLTWAGSELKLPVALGDSGTDGLVAYIAADGRYEFPGSVVTFAIRTLGGSTGFLTAMKLDDLVPASTDDDPVATRVPGDPEYQEVVELTKEIHVPVARYCDTDDGEGCCRQCNARGGGRYDWAVIGLVIGALLLPRRRRRDRRT